MMFQRNIPLSEKTWWKIGGEAEFFYEPNCEEELREAYLKAVKENQPVTILGGGTNVLVSDEGVPGLVISTQGLNHISCEEKQNQILIRAQAGVPKSELTKIFLRKKQDPALFLCGLPGDVGGGVVMNAGVSEKISPREFGEIVQSIKVLKPDGSFQNYSHHEISWKYRKSLGWQEGIVVEAILHWDLKENPQVMARVREATRRRLERQPLNQPSCGSTFKNPSQDESAGSLIERAGLKGYQVGQAQVSMKHANFIVNLGGARAQDVHQIIQHIQKTVFERFSIELETEVRYLGLWRL